MADLSDEYMSDAESVFSEDDLFEMGDEENRPSPQKKTKGKAISMEVEDTSIIEVLGPNNNAKKAGPKGTGKQKTVEEMYQKKTQLEHILLRPDTYIGSVERLTQPMYVLNNDRIIEREITYTPGLYKIFDEIVVNAADNKQRDSNMDKIDVVVDPEANQISVKNNGKGIPVVMHKEHNVYVPTLIFGHLLTGSNFDDDEKKTTGGRNGYGAKLANVFSTEFIIECVDTDSGLKFRQVFLDNMTNPQEPTVKKCTAAELKQGDYVKITFSPDLARFGMTHLDADMVGLMSKRAYDVAGTMACRGGKKIAVSLNGKKLAIKSFKEYLAHFDGINAPVAYETVGDRWEVGVAVSDEASMKQISFINAICTSKGGGHVSYIADQVASHLAKVIKKKNKGGADIKVGQIKNHMTIFVNCLIENPAFDSQTKDFLTTRPKNFGTECKLSDKFLKAVEKSEIVEAVMSFARHKQNQALKRLGGVKRVKLTGITKLDDANCAGTAKSKDCTLIITEGDSAKSLAMSGLSVIGRDLYGVFPLKGKPLNVRDATYTAVMKNEEIKNLVDIMGLKFGTKYDESNIKTLRYGHLMIMADQDTDGSHIKGLIVNLIHNYWPSLLDVHGFLQQFITPIVKVTKGKKSRSFFNIPEYDNWLESTGNEGKGYTIKYYKGLGTSTSAEAKDYFSNLQTHEVHFATLSSDIVDLSQDDELAAVLPDTATSGSDLIDMVFRKSRVNDRKDWLNALTKDTYLDYSAAGPEGVKYSDFINREYVLFSNYDNERSIPHVVDGMKPSQRKVLFGCIKRKLRGEIKVAQLVGYVAEHSSYHHGEASLQGTIVNMAQNFCGSNNVNLLTPSGQFGTRRMGGKDAASPRYIFTKLETIARLIFHPDDDELLNYLKDDGANIEPEFYVPVIPMILVNGAEGIGTGWSTSVNNYDPREIIANLRRKIAGEEMEVMLPSYGGFTGDIIPETGKRNGSFIVSGKIERVDDTTLYISELPIRKWTQDYKAFLEELLIGKPINDTKGKEVGRTPVEIKDFKENHTDTTVSFTITADKAKIDEFEREKKGLYGKFKLTGTLSTSNMTLFDTSSRLVKYDTPEDIFSVFYDIRVDFYVKRKNLLVENLRLEQKKLSNKARFVEAVCAGELVVSNRKRTDILQELQDKGFDCFKKDPKTNEATNSPDEEEENNDTSSDAEIAKGYEYLLGMKIWSLTFEKAEELRRQLEEKNQALLALEATSPTQIWLNDLDAIEVALDERDVALQEAVEAEKRAQKKNASHQAKKKTKNKGSKKKKDEWDSESEGDSEEEGTDSDNAQIAASKQTASRPRATVKAARPTAKKVPATKPPATKRPATKPSSSLSVLADLNDVTHSALDDLNDVTNSALDDLNATHSALVALDAKAAPKAAAPKAAAKAAPKAAAKRVTKTAPKAAVKAAPKVAVKPSKAADSESDSDEDILGPSLLERMRVKMVVSPPAKKPAARANMKTSKMIDMEESDTDSVESAQDSLGELDSNAFVPASVTPARNKVGKSTQAKKKPAPTKKATVSRGAAAAKKTQKSIDLCDSDSDNFEFNSDEEENVVKKPVASARVGRNANKKVYYAFSDGNDDDEDSGFE